MRRLVAGRRLEIPSRIVFALAVLAALPVSLRAQLAPDTPRLMSPNGPGGLGIHLLYPDVVPGDDTAVLMTWAMPALPSSMRLRGGVGIGAEEEIAGFVGVDVQVPITRSGGALPFDLDWQAGAGLGLGDHFLITIPVGLTGGVAWSSGSVWMAPYVSAGLAGDFRFGGGFEEDEFEVDPTLDIGLDLSFDRSRYVVVRSAVSLGDRRMISIGLALGGGGRTRLTTPSPN